LANAGHRGAARRLKNWALEARWQIWGTAKLREAWYGTEQKLSGNEPERRRRQAWKQRDDSEQAWAAVKDSGIGGRGDAGASQISRSMGGVGNGLWATQEQRWRCEILQAAAAAFLFGGLEL
jgi:hypothetical protein